MKKHYLFVAAAATMLTACVNLDTLNGVDDYQGTSSIGFSTFTSHQTKAENSTEDAKSSLSNFNNNFLVWGYKTINATTAYVFGKTSGDSPTYPGQLVQYSDPSWTYSPIRGWDKSSSQYKFYAAAPSTAGWVWDATNNALALNDFVITGTNAVSTVGTENAASEPISVNSEDLMISTDKTVVPAQYGSPVQLDFNHILSRLNIGVQKGSEVYDYTVKLNSIKIFNLIKKASFDEDADLTSVTPIYGITTETGYGTTAYTLSHGVEARWTKSSVAADKFTSGEMQYVNADGLEITSSEAISSHDPAVASSYQYVFKGLVIPQTVTFAQTKLPTEDGFNETTDLNIDGSNRDGLGLPYIEIDFEIGTTVGTTYTKGDGFKYYYNLADVFNATTTNNFTFCEGWQNTLLITLKPDVIEFTPMVYNWEDKEVTIEVE